MWAIACFDYAVIFFYEFLFSFSGLSLFVYFGLANFFDCLFACSSSTVYIVLVFSGFLVWDCHFVADLAQEW